MLIERCKMKITPTSVSLSLILHSIDHLVLPEVSSKGLRDQIGYIRLAVSDLLKRHGPLISLLHNLNAEGLSLENRALRFLDQHESHYQHSIQGRNFDDLAAEYAALTARLQQLAIRLVNEQSENPDMDPLLWQMAAWERKYYQELPKAGCDPFGETSPNDLELTLPLTEDAVERLLVGKRGPLKVQSLTRNPGGFSKQTYFTTIKHEDGLVEELVIRLADSAPLLDTNTFNLEREYDLLSQLYRLEFP